MLKKILIANRGEIAVRIVRACSEMGIRSVAIYTEPDRYALHVKRADESYSLGEDPLEGYLDPVRLVNLAVETGCDAIHPGYGFLSENARFARLCEQNGIIFIGPKASVIEKMGDKTAARDSMRKAGVPITPGSDGNLENIEEALESLADHVSLEIEEEGTLSIKAHVSTGWLHYDKDELKVRELSAEIANEFVNQLDIVNKRLQTEQAVHQRKFLGERYGENLMDLIKAEEKLKQFKENHNIISIESQTRTAIESAAALKNQILINEVQKGVVSRKLKLNHPEIIGIEDEIRELTVKLHEIEYGRDTSENVRGNLFLVLSEIPQIDADLMRLTREVDIQSTLFIYLTQQYEDAKIQEAKNTPTIQLLDPAVTPIKKSSPKRLLMVFIMALITFVFSSIYALIKVNYAPGDNL